MTACKALALSLIASLGGALVACGPSSDSLPTDPPSPGKKSSSSGGDNGSSSGGGGGASSSSSGSSGGANPIANAQKCDMPDLAAAGKGLSENVRRIRVADDGGSVYVLFNHKLHHYTVGAGTDCTLTLDSAFNTTGELDADSFDLGPAGKVTTQTFFGIEVHDAVTGEKTYDCKGQGVGVVSVSPDGQFAYTFDSTKPADSKKFTLGPDSCTATDAWTTASPWATDKSGYASSVAVTSDTITVGAQEAVIVYGRDGTEKARMGYSASAAQTDDGICYLNDMVLAPDNTTIDAIDTNCPSLRRYDTTGKFIKRFTITDLVGAPYTGTLGTRPNAIGIAPTGERFLAIETASGQEMWRLPSF